MLSKKYRFIKTNCNDSKPYNGMKSITEQNSNVNAIATDSNPSNSLNLDSRHQQQHNTLPDLLASTESINRQQTQRRRKCIILSLGCLLCVVGLTIILSFTISIQFNYYPKCIDPENYKIGNRKWTDEHPEMSYYNQYCRKRVVTIFNDYPCNCRQLNLTPQHPTDIPTSTLDSMLSHWTQMEGFRISPDQNPTNATIYYNFSETSMNLEFLKILNVQHTNVGKIDQSIGYLMPRLVIFSIW